ncbi:MAG TPA: hypothetical protein VJ063_09380 [Verrucomicrobiae bacterium]|nr:hypothetical protein [Verrucomicrobiae bacterium]
MNLLDENFPLDQAQLLRRWRIPFRVIGRDISFAGVQDPDIVPLLHRIGGVTFFTQDEDFFERRFCHTRYCLAFLNVRADDAATCLRRFLRHHTFRTRAGRMGIVARVHYEAIHFWRLGITRLQKADWDGH